MFICVSGKISMFLLKSRFKEKRALLADETKFAMQFLNDPELVSSHPTYLKLETISTTLPLQGVFFLLTHFDPQ